ncbi:hypothetical protein LTR10_021785 [Elasticomyces elasticus]|uniref:Uncharacterized protein n=1 Tax=Exophiala sideris TaxID=1016849 RepID=A0ABR0J6I4_9EURO|nr:hypothetical protein LTR10_021785 [Elasticomyces elasticus]KAK5028723.1 hypothetical protein LTS07_006102 [Exophiala sideris]KAK5035591.1 hypothetical protein LTR13_005720 [Exophiala sideris]KAK5057227.1 hypothetical protein LTR69_007266 [Exophiala sideris]KAK5181800.1 hypothetical protein LTR44_006000 [Eurotiomycetes sp. CCFEE 6388]
MASTAESLAGHLSNARIDRHGQAGNTNHHALLDIPSEIRIRVYECLFSVLSVSPAYTSHQRQGSDNSGGATNLADLSIFLVCRKIYQESHPVFLRQALFVIKNTMQHEQFTQPLMLPKLNSIRNLSVAFPLLPEWPPTLLRLVMLSLASFEITDITAEPGHVDMLEIEGHMGIRGGENRVPRGAGLRDNPSAQLFQLIIATMDKIKAELVLAHCNAGLMLTRDVLSVQFKVKCRHVGQVVVPGQFPMVAVAPHEHPIREVVYTFGRRRAFDREVG